jgi:hypothetical protein
MTSCPNTFSTLLIGIFSLLLSFPAVAQTNLELKIEQLTSGEKYHSFGYMGQCQTTPWNAKNGTRQMFVFRVGAARNKQPPYLGS